jgi:hypothetical protein
MAKRKRTNNDLQNMYIAYYLYIVLVVFTGFSMSMYIEIFLASASAHFLKGNMLVLCQELITGRQRQTPFVYKHSKTISRYL